MIDMPPSNPKTRPASSSKAGPTAIDLALERVREFVTRVSGQAPADAEIADALRRYFVLKEIADHIEMVRRGDA